MTKLKSRLIIGLAVLTLTTSVFADTKTDYDQAIQYAKENKVDDAVKLVEKLWEIKNQNIEENQSNTIEILNEIDTLISRIRKLYRRIKWRLIY